MNVKRLTDYTPYISCGPHVTAYLGLRVALIIDDNAGLGEDISRAGDAVMDAVVNALDRMLPLYDACVGKVGVFPVS